MEFYINLIVVQNTQTKEAYKYLKDNCTRVCECVYLYEGDIECLDDDGVKYNFIEEGVVPCLGNKTERMLIELCKDVFDVNARELRYKGKFDKQLNK